MAFGFATIILICIIGFELRLNDDAFCVALQK